MNNLTVQLEKEALRIEEDSEHSAKGHYNTADRWKRYHLAIGLPAAILAAIASGTAFNNMPETAGVLAILATALTTVLTFLKPSEHAENHKAIAGQYLALRNQTRLFREIELIEVGYNDETKNRLIELAKHRDDLNLSSPSPNRKDYELARSDIEAGFSQYKADKEGK
ncbi:MULTISPECIES: SLATT domain-containing protein [Legionella]|uniref:SMODS and SLOG-associating 2TM effector domain-containing protein n=1 Tax=Legionella drozanskii LLAP-1 TaxID=1212489 RepID=A0A0W0SNI5_9GAMM|nr:MULTISPECIES: SLATT domain-containing protein [Legionella]KTC84549.1 hypothetical protein Ldro_2713 [Legionella drozanskii LLAP-1]PJE09563.1 MAG: hypothetical protein CK430_10955 [Legionella sp.]